MPTTTITMTTTTITTMTTTTMTATNMTKYTTKITFVYFQAKQKEQVNPHRIFIFSRQVLPELKWASAINL